MMYVISLCHSVLCVLYRLQYSVKNNIRKNKLDFEIKFSTILITI